MIQKPEYYVGIDTHKYTHTVSIINGDTDKIHTFSFENRPKHFKSALEKIKHKTNGKKIVIGLEDVKSFGYRFSVYLHDLGYDVYHINPERPSYYRQALSNYKKNDDFDAYCVARSLRDDYKRLKLFKHDNQQEIYSNIRLLVSQRERVSKYKSINYRSLHEQIEKVYPGYEKFFCNLQTKSALAFYYRFPSSSHLKGYTSNKLVKEMKELTRIFKVSTADKILLSVQENKVAHNSIYVEESIITLIETIWSTEVEINAIEEKLEVLLEESGLKLHTVPNISIASASMIISEIGDITRFKNDNQLARYCGIAPTTVGSGGKEKDFASKGGNRTLRSTIYFIAVGMISTDIHKNAKQPQFRSLYDKKIQEGKTKSQALVCIMRQLVRILFQMMKHKTAWNPPQVETK